MQKIVIVSNSLTAYGGGERWVLETASRLKKKFEITILNPVVKGAKERVPMDTLMSQFDLRGVRIVDLPCSSVKTSLPGIGKFTMAIPKGISSRMLDQIITDTSTVYIESLNPFLVRKVLKLSKKHGKRAIIGIHNPELTRAVAPGDKLLKRITTRYYNAIQRALVYGDTSAIHVQTESQLKLLRKMRYQGKIYYIPHYIYPMGKSAPVAHRKAGRFTILFVARPSIHQKGIDLLAEVVDKVLEKNREIEFHLIGKGEDGEAIMRDIAARHKQNVRFMGFIPDTDLRKEYQNADLFILTSRYETPGLALLEAQAQGLPAVAFDVPGPTDIMKKDFQGVLVKPFDTSKFAEAVIRLCGEYASSARLAKAKARITAEIARRYDEGAFVRKFTKMLKDQRS
jgi:glycosyltransferase involved in cell wall biosynthesis